MAETYEQIEEQLHEWELDPTVDTVERARATLSGMKPGDPGRALLLLVTAEHLTMRGDHAGALKLLDEAEADGGEPACHLWVARLDVHLETGTDEQVDELLTRLRGASRDDELPEHDYLHIAESLEHGGRLKDAHRWFNLALKEYDPGLEPDSWDRSLLLGRYRVRRALTLPLDSLDRLADEVRPVGGDEDDDDWDLSDEELDAMSSAWDELDEAAADYLVQLIPDAARPVEPDDVIWLDSLAATVFGGDLALDGLGEDDKVHLQSAVAALQHVDWLGLVIGAVRRGPGSELDAEEVQRDVEALEDVEGEIEDPEGHQSVLRTALLALTPRWQQLGVLDEDGRLTERGVLELPRALVFAWRH